MTFSQKVKNELINSNMFDENAPSILAGVILSSGSLVLSNRTITFCISSESQPLIEFTKKLILRECPQAELVEDIVKRNFKNKDRFEMTVDGDSGKELLSTLGIVYMDRNGNRQINNLGGEFLYTTTESRIAFLAGLFLGSGSVSVPESIELAEISKSTKSSGYHMEWVCSNENLAQRISEELSLLGIIPKKVERYESFVVYIKESDAISTLLGLLGAHKSLLELENEKAGRQMRNLINRQANCISANIDKTVKAASEQLEAIEVIKNTIGIEALSEPLQEIALARLSNPDGSLVDIQAVLESKISKGAVSQRFKKLIEISNELK